MQNIFNYIDNLILIALIILAIYLFVSFFLSDMAKTWFNKLSKAPDLTMVFIFLIIFFYPFLLVSLLRDWFDKGKSMDEKGWSITNEVFKQLHVDKDDERRAGDKVFFIGWRHLLGLHLPILLIWIAMWLYIINFIMIKFF
jgi:hypothetical protein